MSKLAVVRLRGSAHMPKGVRDTLTMLRLKTINSANILENNPVNVGMIRKVEDFVAWGETSQESIPKRLHPARGGLRSTKEKYPKGDLGYRGDKIDALIDRMVIRKGSEDGKEKSQ